MKKLLPYLTVFILFLCITIPLSANNGIIETKNGLAYKDLKIGQDGEAQLGDTATIHFIGWLDDKGQRGREIYNSRKEKKAVPFVIG